MGKTSQDVRIEQLVRELEALRREHAEALVANEMMATAQRIAQIGSWATDRQADTVSWSPEMYRIYGLDESTPPGLHLVAQAMPEADFQALMAATIASGQTGEPFHHEHTVRRPDGEIRQVLARGYVRLDEHGAIRVIQGTVQDVTEERGRETELQRQKVLFEQLMRATTEQAIMGVDGEGRTTIWNRGAEVMFGYSTEEMLGRQTLFDIHRPEDLPRMMRIAGTFGLPMHGVTGLPSEADLDPYWTMIRKDGSRLTANLRIFPMTDERGDLTGTVGVAVDVTERLRAQRELAERAQMLRAVIENNQSLITIKDLEGRYLLANLAFQRAFGVTEEEVLAGTDLHLDPVNAPEWRINLQRAAEGPLAVEEFADLADGRHVYESVKVPLYDDRGVVYAVCSLSLDVTQRRRAMLAMEDARDRALAANAAKSAFLATMSHEIRTPMNAVIGLTDLVLESALDDQQRDLLATVRSSGEHLLAIINDVLDFTKVEAGELDLQSRPFDVRDLAEQTLAQFRPRASALELVDDVDASVPSMLVGDAGRLRQVLVSLVGNAVKFTPRGSVRLSVSAKAAQREGEALVLRFDVTDTGIGIPEEAMHRLFRSFSQVDDSTTRVYGGTGLGLAISRGLVEAMGGKIWVTSTPGEGSTFSFTVGVVPAPSAAPAVAAVPAPREPRPRPEALRVLLAEDNAVNQKVARMMLAKLGHTDVTVADNGALALAAAHAHPFDLVLMDIHMPEMDGLEATRRIRAELPAERQPYVVAVTASVTQEDRDACTDAGMDGYVPKPIKIDDLAASIEPLRPPPPTDA